MPDDVPRADADWLAIRETADAAARSKDLVEALRPYLPTDGMVIHDLGCGTGSMARWLAPRLAGRQRWVGYERDDELLALASATAPPSSLDGVPVTTEGRLRDITRLPDTDLDGASLITASALLDMMTSAEIDRLVTTIAAARCPALISLTVVGRVDLSPGHPVDRRVGEAFNEHQTRESGHGRGAGPHAARVAADGLARAGLTVTSAPSPWQLDSTCTPVLTAWLDGWVHAAGEQEPALRGEATEYLRWRQGQAAAGRLSATVHHLDLLALPRDDG